MLTQSEINQKQQENEARITALRTEQQTLEQEVEDALAIGESAGRQQARLRKIADEIQNLELANRGLERRKDAAAHIAKRERLESLYEELRSLGKESQETKQRFLVAATEAKESSEALQRIEGRFYNLEREAQNLCRELELKYEPETALHTLNKYEADTLSEIRP